MGAGLKTIQLAVKHVRDRRQRMPIHRMNMAKCTGYTAIGKSVGYFGIFVNLTWVIIVNKVVLEQLSKDNPREHGQTNANAETQPAATAFRTACRLSSALVHASNLLRCANLGENDEGQMANKEGVKEND
jgi:hypothetical protein